MQPGFDLRLRAMAKALSEVVLPAIDPANRAAVEQAGIVLASLELVRQQVDFAHWYEAAELISLCGLARGIGEVVEPGAAANLRAEAAAGLEMSRRWDLSLTTLRDASAALRELICGAVENACERADASAQAAVRALVLKHSEEQLGRERAYVAGTRWDIFPDTLQTIEASLPKAP
jgi:hypothetical protein